MVNFKSVGKNILSEMTSPGRILRASLLILAILLAAACQEEKYTDKGIPEVELISVKPLEGGGAVFEGRILSDGSDDVIEHGFLWSTDDDPQPGTAEKVLLGPGQGPGHSPALSVLTY